jgi:hypothetical protein
MVCSLILKSNSHFLFKWCIKQVYKTLLNLFWRKFRADWVLL